jgi:hypothetical protein
MAYAPAKHSKVHAAAAKQQQPFQGTLNYDIASARDRELAILDNTRRWMIKIVECVRVWIAAISILGPEI